jgi:hypothetical protein
MRGAMCTFRVLPTVLVHPNLLPHASRCTSHTSAHQTMPRAPRIARLPGGLHPALSIVPGSVHEQNGPGLGPSRISLPAMPCIILSLPFLQMSPGTCWVTVKAS